MCGQFTHKKYVGCVLITVIFILHCCIQAQFVRSEKNVKELTLSVDLMKKESKKLLERSTLAEKDMKRGHYDLRYKIVCIYLVHGWGNLSHSMHLMFEMIYRDTGSQIQSLARSVYKVEAEAAGMFATLCSLELFGSIFVLFL